MSETLIGVAECRNVVVGCIIDVGDYVSDVVDLKKQIESRIRSIKKQRPSQAYFEMVSSFYDKLYCNRLFSYFFQPFYHREHYYHGSTGSAYEYQPACPDRNCGVQDTSDKQQ